MPATPWGPNQNPLLSGMFGSFQRGAAEHETTTAIWERLRQNAGEWEQSVSGRGGTPTISELQEAGREVLAEQGVGALQVNEYRRVAGEWLGAKERLEALGREQQVTASAIFRPPWAQTASGAVPEAFKARVQWQITPTSGEAFTKWSTYELTSPLLTTGDVIDQATAAMENDRYLMLLSGGAPPTAENLEIEQI